MTLGDPSTECQQSVCSTSILWIHLVFRRQILGKFWGFKQKTVNDENSAKTTTVHYLNEQIQRGNKLSKQGVELEIIIIIENLISIGSRKCQNIGKKCAPKGANKKEVFVKHRKDCKTALLERKGFNKSLKIVNFCPHC